MTVGRMKYVTVLSVSMQYNIGDWWTMNRIGFGRKRLWPHRDTFLGICLKVLRKTTNNLNKDSGYPNRALPENNSATSPLGCLTQRYNMNFTMRSTILLLSACFHAGILLGLFFDHEYGSDMFLWNVGWFSTDYMALYFRRRYAS
jgi:hypothetical protein